MHPYLHLGPLNIPTFGLMVATGLLLSAYILQADFNRRRLTAAAFWMIGVAGIAGIVGARLYHALESPGEFFADPWPWLISRFGFAWFGGFLGGLTALLILARRAKLPILEFLDACSPAAAAGYAIGRIGCLLSGDGDYGVPTLLPWGLSFSNGVVPTTERVHPTPVYAEQPRCVHGHGAEDIGSGDARLHPAINVFDGQRAACFAGQGDVHVGAEGHVDADFVSALQAVHPNAVLPGIAEGFRHFLREIRADERDAVLFSELEVVVRHPEAVLDGV